MVSPKRANRFGSTAIILRASTSSSQPMTKSSALHPWLYLTFEPGIQDMMEENIGQHGREYTSYKVANLPIEFSTSMPRTQLRPGYGDGFLGAPLQSVPARERPAPRGQGDPRGTSSTHRQHNPGGAHHVGTELGEPDLCGAGV